MQRAGKTNAEVSRSARKRQQVGSGTDAKTGTNKKKRNQEGGPGEPKPIGGEGHRRDREGWTWWHTLVHDHVPVLAWIQIRIPVQATEHVTWPTLGSVCGLIQHRITNGICVAIEFAEDVLDLRLVDAWQRTQPLQLLETALVTPLQLW